MKSTELKNKILELLKEKKAEDILVLDLRGITTITDFFILCNGSVQQHVKAIADNVIDKLKDEGIKCWHVEGLIAYSWVLLDYVDVVVHVFNTEARNYYKLEKLWADAKQEVIASD